MTECEQAAYLLSVCEYLKQIQNMSGGERPEGGTPRLVPGGPRKKSQEPYFGLPWSNFQ